MDSYGSLFLYLDVSVTDPVFNVMPPQSNRLLYLDPLALTLKTVLQV